MLRLSSRRGSSSLGCLTSLAVLAVLLYVGVHVAEPYFRFYQYRDAITQEARFSSLHTDDVIRQNILANADSLALPEGAYHVKIDRGPRVIRISTSYDDSWNISAGNIASYSRPVHFDIDVKHSL